MSGAAAPRARPGRPPSGARERILDAGLDVLRTDGYAGLTIAKVAARAGENKALISYHFGSKQGLVSAAARALGDYLSDEILGGLEGAATVEEVLEGGVQGVWRVLEEDARLARVYFDLSAVSVVQDDVRGALREIKTAWRRTLSRLLREAGVAREAAGTVAVMFVAGLEGLSLEWIERGDTRELRRARRMLVAVTAAAARGGT